MAPRPGQRLSPKHKPNHHFLHRSILKMTPTTLPIWKMTSSAQLIWMINTKRMMTLTLTLKTIPRYFREY